MGQFDSHSGCSCQAAPQPHFPSSLCLSNKSCPHLHSTSALFSLKDTWKTDQKTLTPTPLASPIMRLIICHIGHSLCHTRAVFNSQIQPCLQICTSSCLHLLAIMKETTSVCLSPVRLGKSIFPTNVMKKQFSCQPSHLGEGVGHHILANCIMPSLSL